MPDVKNCLTCKWEPRWNSDGIGECRLEAYPAWANAQHHIRKKPNGDLVFYARFEYEDDCFAFDYCPAYSPKPKGGE